jgi:hypothetical protein
MKRLQSSLKGNIPFLSFFQKDLRYIAVAKNAAGVFMAVLHANQSLVFKR